VDRPEEAAVAAAHLDDEIVDRESIAANEIDREFMY
jgi:hypothetical protein